MIFLDVGNSFVKMGIYNTYISELVCVYRFRSQGFNPFISFKSFIQPGEVVIVSCVCIALISFLREYFKYNKIQVIWVDSRFLPTISLQKKKYLGSDLICQMLAIFNHRKLKNYSYILLVSFGSATTFLVLDQTQSEPVMQGGYILPGVKSVYQSIHRDIPSLPQINVFQFEKKFLDLGTNTQEAMVYGFCSFYYLGIQGLIQEIQKKFNDIYIVGTGGFVQSFSSLMNQVETHLVFMGLEEIWKQERDV